jgi:hypothetical protein
MTDVCGIRHGVYPIPTAPDSHSGVPCSVPRNQQTADGVFSSTRVHPKNTGIDWFDVHRFETGGFAGWLKGFDFERDSYFQTGICMKDALASLLL